MNKPIAWDTLHSFEMWPGRTFFGLDKSSSHCFTLPKKMYPSLISHFNLRKGNLQSNINFKINGIEMLIKKNLNNSVNLITNFLIEQGSAETSS